MQLSESQPFTKRALFVSRFELELASVLNFLYESGYDAIGALQNEEAFRFFEEHDPHILIISKNIDDASRAIFKELFLQKKPSLTIFEHPGGISALKLLIEKNSHI